MIYLVILGLVIVSILSVCVRLILTNPFKTIGYLVRDLFFYFRYKRWNEMKSGQLICYIALFGGGKTLSVVHYVIGQYNRYNDKYVWCRDRKKWVLQQVMVLSNVDLSIPFTKFESLQQIVNCADFNRKYDYEHDTLTVTLVLGDEFSVQMNSRSFKTNIDPLFLNTVLTCRHHHISIIYDAQRFNHVDALLRQVTQSVVSCQKIWRFMVLKEFDAWELENAQNVSLIAYKHKFGWFIRNKDFNAYDTLACVDNLSKSVQANDMLSQNEILELQGNQVINMDVVKPAKAYVKRQKKIASK